MERIVGFLLSKTIDAAMVLACAGLLGFATKKMAGKAQQALNHQTISMSSLNRTLQNSGKKKF